MKKVSTIFQFHHSFYTKTTLFLELVQTPIVLHVPNSVAIEDEGSRPCLLIWEERFVGNGTHA
jgi:hypothetical protein